MINGKQVLDGGDYEQFNALNKTKKAQHIRDLIKDVSIGERFYCELIGRLISENHYFLKAQGITPTCFAKAPPTLGHGGYDFKGFFAEQKKWHPVSWLKAINGGDDFKSIFNSAARLAIQPLIRDYKSNHAFCELCKNEFATEVDHIDPEFNEIVETAFALIDGKRPALPSTSPSILVFQ